MRAWLLNAPEEGVLASTLLRHAYALGYNRDDCRNARRDLGIVISRERDPQSGRTLRWRWCLPVAPTEPEQPPKGDPMPEPRTRMDDDFILVNGRETHPLGDAEYQRLKLGGQAKAISRADRVWLGRR